jgi:hypothetical protein
MSECDCPAPRLDRLIIGRGERLQLARFMSLIGLVVAVAKSARGTEQDAELQGRSRLAVGHFR